MSRVRISKRVWLDVPLVNIIRIILTHQEIKRFLIQQDIKKDFMKAIEAYT
jgi:hypothetical protein